MYVYILRIYIPVWPGKQSPFDTTRININNIEQTVFLIENGFSEETENVFIFIFLRDDFPFYRSQHVRL